MAEKAPNKGGQQEDAASGTRPEKKGRGFAAMDEERQRAIASEGGRAAHEQGRAHEFTPEEAREAGRKGGQASGGARRGNKQAGQNQPKSNPRRPQNEEDENQRILTGEEDEGREDQT